MMTAPSFLPCDVNHADGPAPAQSILRSPADASRRGDFQEFMGQAQAGQSALGGASLSVPGLPGPSDPSAASEAPDHSDRPGLPTPSKPTRPAIDASIAGLLLAMLAQMPKEETRPLKAGGSLQDVPASGEAIPQSDGAGRTLPSPPHDGGATLLALTRPDGGPRSAPPASPGPPMTKALPGADSVPSAMNDRSADPAKIAGLNLSPPISPTTPETAPPGAELALARDIAPLLAPPVPPSGTPVAINDQRMKSALQKNEIAGSAAQKLPPDHPTAPDADGADAAIPEAKIRIPSSFDDPKESAPQWMVMDTTAKVSAAPTLTTNVQPASAPSAGRIEQVERMISREVVMVRQSGAQELAVSLKVDAQTSLFLQLTNHHGQIEVSVRCESGDAAALDAHWAQLQESLARQNVQLLPLQDKTLSSSLSFDNPAPPSGQFQHGPPSGHSSPRPPAPKTEKPSDDAINAAVSLTKSKSKPRHYRGWEKWA